MVFHPSLVKPKERGQDAAPTSGPKHVHVRAYELVEAALASYPTKDKTAVSTALRTLRGPKERAEKKALKPKPTTSELEWQEARDAADKAASRYVRYYWTRGGEKLSERTGRCNTCSQSKTGDKLQCCHWQSRKHFATRWLFQDLGAGCWGCNSKLYGAGRPKEFEAWIIANHGPEWPDKIRALVKIGKRKPTIEEMKEIKTDYEQRLANLLARERNL